MSTKPESKLQRKIRKVLEETVGGFWVKIHGSQYQKAGLPDLLGCVDGLFFGLEVKLQDIGEPTKLQIETISDINRAGGVATIVRSPEEAINIVRLALTKND